MSSSKYKTSSFGEAFKSLLKASSYLSVRDLGQAKAAVQEARDFADIYKSELMVKSQTDDAAEFSATFSSYLEKVTGFCSKVESNDLQKKVPTGDPQSVNRNPGHNPAYDYKDWHDMSNVEKHSATIKFNNRSMESHAYPFHKETGTMAHASRQLMKPESASTPPKVQAPEDWKVRSIKSGQNPMTGMPKPSAPMQTPGVVKPEHMPGAGIRIAKEGHELHGKLGMVKSPNPQMPGKIAVETKPGTVHYFEPHEVTKSKISSPMQKSELVKKSQAALKVLKAASSKKGI